ncbi:MAG: hypothetical protein ACLRSY_01940 [Acutalibacter sp.]
MPCHLPRPSANLIAMTYICPDGPGFTRACGRAATECPVVFPGGVGVVPWMVPAAATSPWPPASDEEYDAAVWAHHGQFASGPTSTPPRPDAHHEKAGRFTSWPFAGQGRILQTIEDDDLRAIAKDLASHCGRNS